MKKTILTHIIVVVVCLPVFGQINHTRGENWTLTVRPEVKSHFYSTKTAFSWGGSLRFERTKWSLGIYHYRLSTDINRGPVPVSSSNPDGNQMLTERISDYSLSGFQVGRSLKQAAGYVVRVDIQLGVNAMARTQKYSVNTTGNSENSPPYATDEQIETGREINLTAEPAVSIEKYIGRKFSAGINGGYLFSTRPSPSSDYTGFSNFNLGISIGYRVF